MHIHKDAGVSGATENRNTLIIAAPNHIPAVPQCNIGNTLIIAAPNAFPESQVVGTVEIRLV